jgi:transposase-like protein
MAKNIIKPIRKRTRRVFSADEKIRIVVEGLRAEISISELARREKISPSAYYRWSKQFLEAGKAALPRLTLPGPPLSAHLLTNAIAPTRSPSQSRIQEARRGFREPAGRTIPHLTF